MAAQLAPQQSGQRLGRRAARCLQLVGEQAQALGPPRVFSITFVHAMLNEEPGMRNSNLLPVNAKGEVRFAVGRVAREARQHDGACVQRRDGAFPGEGAALDEAVDHALQLVAHKDGDDGGRRLVRAEAVVVAGAGDAQAQQGPDTRPLARMTAVKNSKNCRFCAGVPPGSSRFSPSSVHSDQLFVLARAVDPLKRLFVQQAGEAVALGRLFHQLHRQLVRVGGQVDRGEHGGQLVQAGGHLVVLVLAGMPSFQSSSSSSAMNAFTRGRNAPK